ncbi:putative membrane protein YpjA [Streptohalobacillus salinus]|uniref:Putative membrane protein YpjA n=1 Tax=Streptohalobacillus salinus TaxID=621096 RepID=A0A2V3WF08_9BACI|nr:DUF1405 domain-containing protein [Streptohalobacillus salinus]PXW91734.1 putative membrane protein YpjA [Streptohalobacillus salinus]
MIQTINYLLRQRAFLIVLFVINFFGTVYGYIWYGPQLSDTPWYFLIFVPDSPTASLFFTIFIGCYLFNKHVPLIEALAVVTLFKYGIWAVVMNLLTLVVNGSLSPAGYMLIFSHGAMAIQGLLYLPVYRFKWWHLAITAVWTLHNDAIDYLFSMMPRYHSLSDYMYEIGYFTFWLSIVTLGMVYYLKKKVNVS